MGRRTGRHRYSGSRYRRGSTTQPSGGNVCLVFDYVMPAESTETVARRIPLHHCARGSGLCPSAFTVAIAARNASAASSELMTPPAWIASFRDLRSRSRDACS